MLNSALHCQKVSRELLLAADAAATSSRITDIHACLQPGRLVKPEVFRRLAGPYLTWAAARSNSSAALSNTRRRLRFLLGILLGGGLVASAVLTLGHLTQVPLVDQIFAIVKERRRRRGKGADVLGRMHAGWPYHLTLTCLDVIAFLTSTSDGNFDAGRLALSKLKVSFRRRRHLEELKRIHTPQEVLEEAGLWIPADEMIMFRTQTLEQLNLYRAAKKISLDQAMAFQGLLILSLFTGIIPVQRPQILAMLELHRNFSCDPMSRQWQIQIRPDPLVETKRSCEFCHCPEEQLEQYACATHCQPHTLICLYPPCLCARLVCVPGVCQPHSLISALISADMPIRVIFPTAITPAVDVWVTVHRSNNPL
jgi:hypothetical protein